MKKIKRRGKSVDIHLLPGYDTLPNTKLAKCLIMGEHGSPAIHYCFKMDDQWYSIPFYVKLTPEEESAMRIKDGWSICEIELEGTWKVTKKA